MEKEILKEWMERFFLAELTMDEERELYQYLCANEVPAELRKDREVILALCSTAEEDIELPEGAAERLEAMLDGLEEMKEEVQILPNSPSVHRGGARRAGALQAKRVETPHQFLDARSFTTFRMTKVLLRAACVVGVAIALFVMLPDRVTEPLLTEVYEEEDTFDNPEDAMQCLMAAYKDVMLVMNATRDNAREAHRTLEYSAATCRDISKLEPIKSNDL